MILRDLNNVLLNRFPSFDKTNSDIRINGIIALNVAIAAIWRSAAWGFRKRLGQLVLIPRYTTGTCSITQYDGTSSTENLSRTVNFSGTTLTSNMVGRFFQPFNGVTWYKIIAISGSQAILDSPIIDATASGISFKIWKRFYYLKSEADQVWDGYNWTNNLFLDFKSDTRLSYEGKRIGDEGNPVFFGDYGVDPWDDITYSTGSISASLNSNVITGSGTSFLGNVNSGDIIKVNTKEYYVKRVESDTSIVLYNFVTDVIASGNPYTIRKNNPIGIQLYFSNDQYRVIDYTYITKPYELKNEDNDLFPMDFDYAKAVWDRAESIMLWDIDKEKAITKNNLAQDEIQSLKVRKDLFRPRANQFNPSIPSFMPGRS